jgi:hypothetical protein
VLGPFSASIPTATCIEHIAKRFAPRHRRIFNLTCACGTPPILFIRSSAMSFHSSHSILSSTDRITLWPRFAKSSDAPPGLYELSPPSGNHAPCSIILYAKASHFMDLDASNQGQAEFQKVVSAFTTNIPALFPDARVLLLWNVTLAFTTRDLLVWRIVARLI